MRPLKPLHTYEFICFVFALIFSLGAAQSIASPRADILPGPVLGDVMEVLDGDTIAVRLKVWIGQSVETHVRLAGIDTPELRGKCAAEREKAKAAQQTLAALLTDGKVTLYNIRLEKYAGRVLAQATNTKGDVLTEKMLDSGYARPYQGAKRQSWCAEKS
jgi:endonuclease YncB( thermonuclease family)